LASTRATIAHSAITISAATHVAIAVSSSATSPAVSAPSASSAAIAAAPSMPAPLPASLPFCWSSARASSISWRTSVEVCDESSLTSSPIGRSRASVVAFTASAMAQRLVSNAGGVDGTAGAMGSRGWTLVRFS
jgi:hypothetical protein